MKLLLFSFYTVYTALLCCCFFTTASALPVQRLKPDLPADTAARKWYLFAYFTEEKKGMQYALSNDGLDWKISNGGWPWLVPELGDQKLMRDPSIQRGEDGVYRVVWTTGWTENSIGYAASTDLVHWSTQRALPVMQGIDSVKMCWAPEIFYNDLEAQYMVMWASAVKGKWSIYYVTTKDFEQFSKAAVLLNNGFDGGGEKGQKGPIDAYIFKDRANRYVLFYKQDENTGVPNLYCRFAASPLGEWKNENGPITPSTGDEGPSCIKIGNEYHVFTDPAESHKAYMFVSADLKNWRRKVTNLVMSHGTVIQLDAATAATLLKQESH